MKFKLLLGIAVALATSFFIVSCDDDIDTIGSGIQPDIDDIFMDVDQVYLTAETVDLGDKVYLRTDKALLGVLDDPILGKTKADFMAEFSSYHTAFKLGHDGEAKVDSVQFFMQYYNSSISGDTLSPMGITIYELDKELDANFYTNVDISKYTNKKNILGQRYFLHSELQRVKDENGKQVAKNVYIDLDKSIGEKLYKAWKADKHVLDSPNTLKKVLRGIYVTNEFNNKALIGIDNANKLIDVRVFYSYLGKKKNEPTIDSTFTDAILLQINGTALQLNSVVDTPNPNLFKPYTLEDKDARTYLKAPAGVVTKVTIPLEEIRKKAKEKTGTDKYTINSSVFKFVGMTEAEKDLKIARRPSNLLFINKDSLENFFLNSKTIDGVSSLLMMRNTWTESKVTKTDNTYRFINLSSSTQSYSDNIANLINHYVAKEKDKEEKTKNLEFYVIPVDVVTETNSGRVYARNALTPMSAIFRTDKDNMKMSLMFSKYNEIK